MLDKNKRQQEEKQFLMLFHLFAEKLKKRGRERERETARRTTILTVALFVCKKTI